MNGNQTCKKAAYESKIKGLSKLPLRENWTQSLINNIGSTRSANELYGPHFKVFGTCISSYKGPKEDT